jgi:hypothetical protein
MKSQDSNKKDVKISADPQAAAASEAAAKGATAKELTDEQIAAVVGGVSSGWDKKTNSPT